MLRTLAIAVAAAASWLSTASAAIVDATVAGNQVTATVEMPGDVTADLTIRFENATGLSLPSLGLNAQTVNPTDPALLSRLQAAGLPSIPNGFAVMVTIEPPANGGLTFNGLVEIELYTKNLHYVAGTPLRFFSAKKGGEFRDVTDLIAGGSYRTRGTKGTFSDFLVVADVRPLPQIIAQKFARLDDTLIADAATIGVTLRTALSNKLASARSAWQAGRFDDAIEAVEEFDDAVRAAADAGQLPNKWSANASTRNLGGELRADARTLRFSLTLASNL